MNRAMWGKALGLGLVGLGLVMVLARIDWLVAERQQRQQEAREEVSAATAGEQLLGAPYLRRECVESWTVVEQVEDERGRRELRRREQATRVLRLPADQLALKGQLQPLVLERGLFKVNTFNAQLTLQARWDAAPLAGTLRPSPLQPGAELHCGPLALVLQVSDARGLRRVALQLNGQALAARPGALEAKTAGLHAELGADLLSAAANGLALAAELELLGTDALHVQPAAAQFELALRSPWPHPSFQGRFLPVQREVGADGFSAQWRLTELASSAAAALRAGEASADRLGVALFDPVNPYSLSDRALKYGFLFIALTLGAVLLAELLGRQRVHPVQYGFVGLALALFFLLLLALSEHLAFGPAYLLAAAACSGLLAHYASSLYGHWRAGLTFGAGVGLLYAVLYLLLNLEKASLLVGSLLLFALLAAAMRATRDVNWQRS